MTRGAEVGYLGKARREDSVSRLATVRPARRVLRRVLRRLLRGVKAADRSIMLISL